MCNYIFNALYLSIFNHTSCGKHNISGCGIEETNAVDVHEVIEQVDFLVSIKDFLGGIWYHDRFHILDLLVDCFSLQIWHTGSINVLIYPDIFSQNW